MLQEDCLSGFLDIQSRGSVVQTEAATDSELHLHLSVVTFSELLNFHRPLFPLVQNKDPT